jgi:hypothetical protein
VGQASVRCALAGNYSKNGLLTNIDHRLRKWMIPVSQQVIVSRKYGLFSNVYSVLGAIDWCELNNEIAVIKFDSGPYHDPARGENWWDHYFEWPAGLVMGSRFTEVPKRTEAEEFASEMALRLLTNRFRTSEIIAAYVRPRSEILESVEELWREKVGDTFCIGVHVRGTDKFNEAPPVPFDLICATVENIVRRVPIPWRLYVATDEVNILENFQSRFGACVACQSAVRSLNGEPIHDPENPQAGPYRLAVEAIVDAYCLSRSSVFIGCQSNLSFFAAAIDPATPWINMSPGSHVVNVNLHQQLIAKEVVIRSLLARISERKISNRFRRLFRKQDRVPGDV